MLEVLSSLNPEIKNLKSELADKISQVTFSAAIADTVTKTELQAGLADKISTNKMYRIKSTKGAVYVSVHDQAAYGLGLSLGDQIHNPNEPGLQWTFVENW